jgi:hypothetical protein
MQKVIAAALKHSSTIFNCSFYSSLRRLGLGVLVATRWRRNRVFGGIVGNPLSIGMESELELVEIFKRMIIEWAENEAE